MRLAIRHVTHYKFDGPVSYALQRLRLTPKETQGQRIVEWKMHLEGATRQLEYDDEHFNRVTLVSVDPGTQHACITCEGTVDTEDNAGVIGHHAGHLPLWAFLDHTPLTMAGSRVRQLIGGVDRSAGGLVETLHNLSSAIREQVTYQSGVTTVDTTAEEALEHGAGVCQDHAHIFIAAARAIGIPARYVSGYLMMNDRVDQEASHAWVEAHVMHLGWVGFDVSNGISPDPRYVRVATGRDYRDAAPVSGISFGGTSEGLSVRLEVEQQTVEQ